MNARLRPILSIIEKQPGVVIDKIEQSKHFKLFLDTPHGKKILVVSKSVSDYRAILNLRSLVRQWGAPE